MGKRTECNALHIPICLHQGGKVPLGDHKGQFSSIQPPSTTCPMRSIASCIVGLTLAVNLGVGGGQPSPHP